MLSSIAAPKAYSYLRFSTPQQMKGDSYRRQTAKAQQYADAHGLVLDDQLTFEDLGVSAYRGKNAETGALAVFLSAVQAGEIAQGSFLLVEHLDRLSRDKARKAARTLEDLVDEGITVVTLNDGARYTSAEMDDDPFRFVMVILTFVRANEESARKSSLTTANWEGKVQKAKADPAKVLTSRCPAWLRLNPIDRVFEVIPERRTVVERIFEMVLAGHGLHRIAETFNREGIDTFGDTGTRRKAKLWHRSYITKIIASPAVIGVLTPHTSTWAGGKRTRIARDPIAGYFPAIIDPDVFRQVQAIRHTARVAPRVPETGLKNVFGGLATCHRCGGTMTRVTKGARAKSGQPYLVCAVAKVGAGCTYEAVKLAALESALVWDAPVLAGTIPASSAQVEAEVADLELRVSLKAASIQNLVGAMADNPSAAISARLALEEADYQDLRSALQAAMVRASASTPLMLRRRLDQLVEAFRSGVWRVEEVNVILRQCFSSVVVDTPNGVLRFQWKHGGEAVLRYLLMPGAEAPSAFWINEDGTMRPISKAFLGETQETS